MTWIPPSTLGAWEQLLVEHFLAIGPDGDASDIRSLEVTPSTLAAACGAAPQEEELVEAAFRRAILADPLLMDTLRLGSRRRSTDKLPNFFIHLALTLFIDSLLDGDYASEGAFRTKLAKWLGVDNSFQQLRGIALMWERLVAWLNMRIKAGAPFRRLVLPEVPRTWTHIGYTRRLSFPNRTDIRLIDRFVSEHPGAVGDPRAVLIEFQPTLLDRYASWGLKSAYEDFRHSYLRHKGRSIAYQRFWRLLTRVRTSHSELEANFAIVEMAFDEDGDRYYFVLSRCADERRAYSLLGDALTAARAADSDNLSSAFARGVLFFRQSGTGRWRAEPDLVGSPGGVHVALTARRAALVGDRLGRLLSAGEWSITDEPQTTRKAEEALERLGLLSPPVEQVSRAKVSNGIHVKSAWLGRPQFLPHIEAEAFDLAVRSEIENSDKTTLSVAAGRLRAAAPVDGSYIVEPILIDGEDRPPWSLRLQFVRNALPHPKIGGARHRLQRLVDWSGVRQLPAATDARESLKWEKDDAACEDLLEAVYADGAAGWEEGELVYDLICRAGLDVPPWTMLRCLQDAGIVEPRLRERWRGRTWTLVAPHIVPVRAEANDLVLAEGALCAQLVDDFRMVVEGMGGTCFRRLGASKWSPPIIGAFDVMAGDVAERLNWPLIVEPDAPTSTPRALDTTNRHADLYQLASTWDWDAGRFVNRVVTDGAVQLTRLVHPRGGDHDVYRIEHAGRRTHYVSRTAAIVAAHVCSSVPLFELRGDRLVRLSLDGGLPDALAADLRRRRLRSAGPVGGDYAYPATEDDGRRLAALLPGCVAGVKTVPNQDVGHVVSFARRSAGRLRPQWREGALTL
ncbi:MAG TPA: hypothetical protein VD978_36870 [Azospirillum sp.]|nr:hypothetical protein [Azospirillum sp.]